MSGDGIASLGGDTTQTQSKRDCQAVVLPSIGDGTTSTPKTKDKALLGSKFKSTWGI